MRQQLVSLHLFAPTHQQGYPRYATIGRAVRIQSRDRIHLDVMSEICVGSGYLIWRSEMMYRRATLPYTALRGAYEPKPAIEAQLLCCFRDKLDVYDSLQFLRNNQCIGCSRGFTSNSRAWEASTQQLRSASPNDLSLLGLQMRETCTYIALLMSDVKRYGGCCCCY